MSRWDSSTMIEPGFICVKMFAATMPVDRERNSVRWDDWKILVSALARSHCELALLSESLGPRCERNSEVENSPCRETHLGSDTLLVAIAGNLYVNRADDTRRGQIPEVLVRVRLNLIEFENTIENLVLDMLGRLKEKRHRTVFQQRKNREKDHDGDEQRADRIGDVPSEVLNQQRRNNNTDLNKTQENAIVSSTAIRQRVRTLPNVSASTWRKTPSEERD